MKTRTAGLVLLSVLCAGCEPNAPHLDSIALRHAADRPEGAPAFSGHVPTLRRSDRPRSVATLRRQFGDSLSFARISSLTVMGDHLLVTDRMMSPHLAMINLRSGEVERHFGNHGEGPREFQDPSWVVVDSHDPPEGRVYDFLNRRLTRVRLGEASGPEVLETTSLNLGLSIQSPVPTASGIIANGIFPDFTFLVLSGDGSPISRLVADPPFTPQRIGHFTGRRMLNRNWLAVRPDGKRIALAYQFASRIDWFTADGDRYGTVAGPRETEARWSVRDGRFFWDDDNQKAYVGAHGGEHHLFALFCGCHNGEEPRPDRIHVFTWDGDFVGELALDRPVFAFTVSPDERMLYGATMEPFPAVGEWELPAWIN